MAALWTLTLLALIGVSSSQMSDCSYYGLLKYLNLTASGGILEIMRPVKNWTTPTLVKMDMLLYGILEVDEKSQTVTSHLWISMRWTNEFLNWKPSEFCGIRMLTVPRSMLWIPDVSIQEDASDTGSIQKSPFASLKHSGSLFVNTRQRITYTCQLNLSMFPFDVQKCNLTFSSMGSDVSSIIIGTDKNDTTLTSLSERVMITQGEWKLVHMEATEKTNDSDQESQSKLIYMVTLERKPMLYVINLIVPLFYLLALDLASFFINEARGEKLSCKITILLSISVLLLILREILPSTEDNLPMIANYFIAIFALVGISVLEAMLVSFLIDLDSYCVKEPKDSVSAEVDIQLQVNYNREPAGDDVEGQVKPEKSYIPLDWPHDRDLLKLILDELKAARQVLGGQDRGKKNGRYLKLAKIIDILFFCMYLCAVIVFLATMYGMWLKN